MSAILDIRVHRPLRLRFFRAFQTPKQGNTYSPHSMSLTGEFFVRKVLSGRSTFTATCLPSSPRAFYYKNQLFNQIKCFALSQPPQRPSLSIEAAGSPESGRTVCYWNRISHCWGCLGGGWGPYKQQNPSSSLTLRSLKYMVLGML